MARTFDPRGLSALLSVSTAYTFESLGLAATIWDGKAWRRIHTHENLIWFEAEHGVESERSRYNAACMHRAWRGRELVIGEHAGLSDVFAPIVANDRVLGVLLIGPFLRARPSATELLERWRWLTGRQGHPADPEFSRYVSMTLSTLVLEVDQVKILESLVRIFIKLIAGERSVAALGAQADSLRRELQQARYVEEVWAAASSMVDEHTQRSWMTPYRDPEAVGLARVPDQVLVGLLVNREREFDPVEELLRRDALQRACVDLARKTGSAIAGRLGDHGITLLSAASGTAARRRATLFEFGERARLLAHESGYRMHAGVAPAGARTTLAEQYQAALAAAENALSEGVRLVEAKGEGNDESVTLGELRRRLSALGAEEPAKLAARFDRYLESVGSHCGYQIEPARAHLEAGFERVAEALLGRSALEEKGLRDLYAGLERAARDARTVSELFSAYRRAVVDIRQALERPVPARRERGLQRAVSYIHRHYTEPLTRPEVARISGFAPSHFSALFKTREKTTFERYLMQLRVERAKQLLAGTDLDLQQVARLSGFKERHYFARAFKQVAGVPPGEHRRRAIRGRQ